VALNRGNDTLGRVDGGQDSRAALTCGFKAGLLGVVLGCKVRLF